MAPISAYSCTTHITLATSNVGRYVPEAELIVVVGTLLPVLAYPFLPQQKNSADDDDTWERFLQICSFIQLSFVYSFNFFILFIRLVSNLECIESPETRSSLDYTILPLWVVYLNLICLLGLDFEKMNKTPRRDHTLGDFEKPAAFTMAILLFEVLRLLSTTFAHATSSWTLGIVIAFIIVGFGFCTLGHAFVQLVCDTIQTCLYRFMTRKVEAWTWLPQNGATEDFKPAWGDALGILTALSGFAVCVGFWWAVLRC